MHDTWLRWCDLEGNVVPIAPELVARADEEAKRVVDALQRAEALAAKLRALGVDPDGAEKS